MSFRKKKDSLGFLTLSKDFYHKAPREDNFVTETPRQQPQQPPTVEEARFEVARF